jgi:hypothetical protein
MNNHLEDYQLEKINNLFNCDLIEDVIDEYSNLTAQQEAVLRFIAKNPDKQYIQLQNTFKMPDQLVVSLVMQYGSTSDEYSELRELKQKVRD